MLLNFLWDFHNTLLFLDIWDFKELSDLAKVNSEEELVSGFLNT